MTLHLLKMCVGITSPEHLRNVQERRLADMRAADAAARLAHMTRNMPRRADELLDGGSLYWIMKGQIRARQRLLAIERDETKNKKCALVLDPNVVETEPRQARPIQGWRYLEAANAPGDLGSGRASGDELPDHLVRELKRVGLL